MPIANCSHEPPYCKGFESCTPPEFITCFTSMVAVPPNEVPLSNEPGELFSLAQLEFTVPPPAPMPFRPFVPFCWLPCEIAWSRVGFPALMLLPAGPLFRPPNWLPFATTVLSEISPRETAASTDSKLAR